MKHTPEQIKECKDYLGLCVKEGYMDTPEAEEIIKKKDWKKVYYYMDKAESMANDNEYQERAEDEPEPDPEDFPDYKPNKKE